MVKSAPLSSWPSSLCFQSKLLKEHIQYPFELTAHVLTFLWNRNSLRNVLRGAPLCSWFISVWFKWGYYQYRPIVLLACFLITLPRTHSRTDSKISFWGPGQFLMNLTRLHSGLYSKASLWSQVLFSYDVNGNASRRHVSSWLSYKIVEECYSNISLQTPSLRP